MPLNFTLKMCKIVYFMLHLFNYKKKKNGSRRRIEDKLHVVCNLAQGQSELISSWGSIPNTQISKYWLRRLFFLGPGNTQVYSVLVFRIFIVIQIIKVYGNKNPTI